MMTDRHAGYLVTLDADIREDDAQAILSAIGMVKGVGSVEPIIADPLGAIAENRARRALWDRMVSVLAGDTPK